jgi:hypothetical protein
LTRSRRRHVPGLRRGPVAFVNCSPRLASLGWVVWQGVRPF